MSRPLSLIVAVLLPMFLAACSGNTPFPQATASTPVDDLPISIAVENVDLIPTPVAQAVVDVADANFLVLSNVYERSNPAVVNIEVVRNNAVASTGEQSRGSGFIYDMDGHVLTNAHVVTDAATISVTFYDNYVTEAQLIGLDTYSDLAVIKVDVPLTRLHPLALADSDRVQVGQRAIAIGNPFGLSSSMSVGIISGLGRTLRSAELIDAEAIPGFQNPSIIQTDTPINPGNSGGPLLNSNGDVIGVTTAIRTESGVFQGVGFAVPSNTVKRVVPELIEKSVVDYSWIGISVSPEENGFGVAGLAEPLNLPVDAGVLIRDVHASSPASKAGLRGGNRFVEIRGQRFCAGGDVIVSVDGRYVNNMDELVAYLVMHSAPGDTINLMIVRGRDTFEVPVTLESRPNTNTERIGCEG